MLPWKKPSKVISHHDLQRGENHADRISQIIPLGHGLDRVEQLEMEAGNPDPDTLEEPGDS